MSAESDATKLVESVEADLGADWTSWPGGWPGEIEAAVIDSVCSIRARYGSPTNGVRGQVAAWRKHRRGGTLDDLNELVAFASWNATRQSPLRQQVSGRLKSDVISDVARRFVEGSFRNAADFADVDGARAIWMGTPGLGFATWKYLEVLLGTPTVKPDTILTRYVARVLERSLTQPELVAIVEAAASINAVDAHLLDHAIWAYERERDRSASSLPSL